MREISGHMRLGLQALIVLMCVFYSLEACYSEFPKSKYRVDFVARGQIDRFFQELTPLDIKMIKKLEVIIANGVGNPEVFSQLRECLVNTDSSVIVILALQTIASMPEIEVPEALVREASKLSACNDFQIKLTICRFLGWFSIPEVFPAILYLLLDENLLVVQIAHSTLPQFGIELIAALPFIPEREKFALASSLGPTKGGESVECGDEIVITPNFRKYISKVAGFIFVISSVGNGPFLAYPSPCFDKSQFRFSSGLPKLLQNLEVPKHQGADQ